MKPDAMMQSFSALRSGLRRAAVRVAGSALDLVLPRSCASCGTETSGPGLACPECFAKLRRIIAPCCDRCGVPLAAEAFAGKTGLCARCEISPPAWDQARAAFVYDDASRNLILPLKYADRTELAAGLGGMMIQAGADLLARADLIVPVPVHWRRRVARRYNQAALLARVISRRSGRPALMDALCRPHATQKLALAAPGERLRIMTDAIRVSSRRRNDVCGQHILLIDDVLTTGATGTACTEALRGAGAASVLILAAARTEVSGREDIDLPDEIRRQIRGSV
ncbi:ComF family protein [Acetobacter sp. AN02]|uniref:ComF family protein n=1 Tax=Acetobacter sp. AN02 TaxID=2894186 RepID=UPI00243459E4|nr:ComF family protein [Acetobacter sp. AN02]MDG6094972.1 ComF family protein [Acetobacter sp. AN02]